MRLGEVLHRIRKTWKVKIKRLENAKEEELAKTKKHMKLEIVMPRKRSIMKEKQVEEEAKKQEEAEQKKKQEAKKGSRRRMATTCSRRLQNRG